MPGGGDIPASAQAELPFAIDVPVELSDDSWVSLEVVSAEANALMSDRLELKTMLNICCETRRRETVTVVQDVSEGEPLVRRSGIVILWPNEGETAWEIGKRYALPALKDGENPMDIHPGTPIILSAVPTANR